MCIGNRTRCLVGVSTEKNIILENKNLLDYADDKFQKTAGGHSDLL